MSCSLTLFPCFSVLPHSAPFLCPAPSCFLSCHCPFCPMVSHYISLSCSLPLFFIYSLCHTAHPSFFPPSLSYFLSLFLFLCPFFCLYFSLPFCLYCCFLQLCPAPSPLFISFLLFLLILPLSLAKSLSLFLPLAVPSVFFLIFAVFLSLPCSLTH